MKLFTNFGIREAQHTKHTRLKLATLTVNSAHVKVLTL